MLHRTMGHNGGKIIAQGELAVGAATVQLIATSTPCVRVWIGAPTAQHTKAGANTSGLLVGKTAAGNASGGVFIDKTNTGGVWFEIIDASQLYITGGTAGDVAEYQIWA